ncbi:transcription termination/antitermination protein NusA, partial [Ureaplasma urealyticum]
NIDLKQGTINCFRNLVVVENEKVHNEDLETCLDDAVEILLDDARKINANAQIGDLIKQHISIDNFKSIEVGQIGSLLRQKITEIHNKRVADFWKPSLMKMIRAKVAEVNYNKQRNEITGVKVELDDQWKTLGYLSRKDRIGDEKFKVGETYDFLIKEVKEQSRLWPILLSRTEPELVEEILKREVVDIKNGNIEIKKIARIAGFKTKVAVSTNLLNIEPVAVVVGNKGLTITSISKQLNNERIDIIRYADDKRIFIANAIGLDKLKGLLVQENESGQRSAIAIVSKDDLPSVIGRGGANIRLIAKITEWNIDVKTIEQAFEENILYEKFDEKIYRSWNIESINKKNVTNDEMLALIDSIEDDK